MTTSRTDADRGGRPPGLVEYTRTRLTPDDLSRSDQVHAALTDAVHALGDAQLRTTVDLAEIEHATTAIRQVTDRLLQQASGGSFGIELGHDDGAREHGNAVLGLRNPFAAAVGRQAIRWDERGATATLELGALYEGPPGCVHGGVIALVLDQLFTEAAAAVDRIGMTAALTVRYLRPTPLGTVVIDGWLEEVDGLKRRMRATCRDADGHLTAEAEALLVLPRWLEGSDAIWPKRPPATSPGVRGAADGR